MKKGKSIFTLLFLFSLIIFNIFTYENVFFVFQYLKVNKNFLDGSQSVKIFTQNFRNLSQENTKNYVETSLFLDCFKYCENHLHVYHLKANIFLFKIGFKASRFSAKISKILPCVKIQFSI